MELIGFGLNTFGQLGIGSRVRKEGYVPTKFGVPKEGESSDLPSAEDIADIQCGCHSTIVLDKNGDIRIAGSVADIVSPVLERINLQFPQKAIELSCGRKHVLLLFEGGCVMSWGTGYFGQLGHGNDNSLEDPVLINALTPQVLGARVTHVAAGGNHSGCVTDGGIAFMWGLNRSGQCGANIKSDVILTPKPIDTKRAVQMNGGRAVKVRQLVCGRNHSAFVSTENKVYTWGATTFGRTGLNVSSSVKVQSIPWELPGINCVKLACGDFHMVAMSESGSLYSWGYGCDGQPGHSSLLHVRRPRKLDYFDDRDIVIDEIQCGSCYSMAKDVDGYVYAWGYGDGGWLGLKPLPEDEMPFVESDEAAKYPIINGHANVRSFDSIHSVIVPQKVTLLKNKVVHSIRCGGAHSVLFVTPRPSSSSALSSVFDEKIDDSLDAKDGLGYKNMMMDSDEDEGDTANQVLNSATGKK
jgi:alpha-tubulin suppressor-like RCC1 family protein